MLKQTPKPVQKPRRLPADREKKQAAPEEAATSSPTTRRDPKADAMADKELKLLAHEWSSKLDEGMSVSQIRAEAGVSTPNTTLENIEEESPSKLPE